MRPDGDTQAGADVLALTVLAIDGVYGPATTAAVRRFQGGYGSAADGVAGPNTFGRIYELQGQ